MVDKKKQQVFTHLAIVGYAGGQIDKSLKSTVVLNANQFLFGYEEEDKGFAFVDVEADYGKTFSLENLTEFFKLNKGDADSVIDALYSLDRYGYRDGDGEPDPTRFLSILTGSQVNHVKSVDPRAMFQ